MSGKEQDHAALFGGGAVLGVPEDVLWDEWLKKYPADAHLRPKREG